MAAGNARAEARDSFTGAAETNACRANIMEHFAKQ